MDSIIAVAQNEIPRYILIPMLFASSSSVNLTPNGTLFGSEIGFDSLKGVKVRLLNA